jgi:hypothetical protein
MNRGYVKLWRKSLEGGWLQNPELWTFWTWCLLKASHKVIVVRVGFQEITLEPGQFIFGRLRASKELKMSERKIRSCIDLLRKADNLTIKTTNKFSIITIVNWPTYQADKSENGQQNDQPATSKRPQTRIKKNVKKNPNEIFSEISLLTDQIFSSPEGIALFTKTIEAISTTRKTNRIFPSVILKLIQDFQGYPEGQVLTGMKTYLEKDYHKEGKKEAYLLGIIRNQKPDPTPIPEFKSTGSPLLDAYNRGRPKPWGLTHERP